MIVFGGCEKEELILPVNTTGNELNNDYWGMDFVNRIIVYNGNSTAVNNRKLIIGNIVLDVETDDKTISIGKAYNVKYSEEVFKLFYTHSLPYTFKERTN